MNEDFEIVEGTEKKSCDVGKKIAKLIDVKSIVTLILTLVFAYMAMSKMITPENYMTIFTVIIAFYFGTQAVKNKEV